jgi:hypothetical protein
MSLARPGDLVVLTPTEVEDMWSRVLAFRPKPWAPAAAEADGSQDEGMLRFPERSSRPPVEERSFAAPHG